MRDTDASQDTRRSGIKDLLSSLSIEGIGHVIDEDVNIVRRVWWVLLITAAVATAVAQITIQVLMYHDYPVTVDMKEHFERSLTFPAITACPESRFSRQKLAAYGNGIEDLYDEDYHPYLNPDEILQRPAINNLSAISNEWRETYRAVSKSVNDSLLYCDFRGYGPCQPAWITKKYNVKGECITFNADGHLQQHVPGGSAGLWVFFHINETDSIGMTSLSSGVRLTLHHPDDHFSLWADFTIPRGFVTTAQLAKQEFFLLEPPHENCADRHLDYFSKYSHSNCLLECLSKKIQRSCACTLMGYPGSLQVCDPRQEVMCALEADLSFDNYTDHECDCPVECHVTVYSRSLSMAPVSKSVVKSLKIFWKSDLSEEELLENTAGAFVYYPKLSYQSVTSQVGYTATSLFCDIGGAFGLFLGSTLLTVYELADFAVWNFWQRCRTKKSLVVQ